MLRFVSKLKLILFGSMFCIIAMQASALETVKHVDLERYLGTWYEIARFDVWFERNCTNVTAVYTISEENKIEVLNTCYLYSATGKKKEAYGRATVVDTITNAKLSVSFLPVYLSWFDKVLSGDYWILKLEPDYSIVLVGDDSREYLWILSRTATISKKKYEEYVSAARELGFEVNNLLVTTQDWDNTD